MARQNIDLTQGSIRRQFVAFTIPLLLSALLQQLYNTVDLLIVGRFAGEVDMAAIGATGPIINLIVALFIGLSTGVSVLVAQYYSAKGRDDLAKTIETNFAIAIYGGALLTITTYLLAPLFLSWMGTPETILGQSVSYMRIIFLGVVPVMVYNMGSGILRSVGDSIRPFNFLVVSAGLNIILDLFFIGYLKMGARGAGIATALAQSVSGLLTMLSLMRTTDIYRLNIRRIRFHKDTLIRIFSIGLPAGIQSALISFSNVVIQSQINLFGSAAIAGVAVSGRIDGFVFTTLSAFSVASTTFSAQNIGAGRFERLKNGVVAAIAMVSAFMISVSILIVVFRKPLMAVFNDDPNVIEYGQRMLLLLSPGYLMTSLSEVLGGFIRGSGKSLPIMLITIMGMFVIRLTWIYTAMPIYQDIDIIYLSYPISWFVTLVLTLTYYRLGRWRPKQLRDQTSEKNSKGRKKNK